MAELAETAHAVAEHSAEGQTVQEYIQHHLSFLTYGRNPLDGTWGIAHTPRGSRRYGLLGCSC